MLPERWKKCVDSGGEYVEDWHVQVSVWQLWLQKKISPGHIWTTLYNDTFCCSFANIYVKSIHLVVQSLSLRRRDCLCCDEQLSTQLSITT
jgi:hypothetical protein